MSSFDDRVQRAIAAAIRDHLQYHLDDQQIEQVINNIDVHVDCPCQSQQQDDCCDVVLELLRQLIRDIEPLRNLRRALEEEPNEDPLVLPETGDPGVTEGTHPGSEFSKPVDPPTASPSLPSNEGWYFDEWLQDVLRHLFLPNGSTAPMPAIPILPAPATPMLPVVPLAYQPSGYATNEQLDQSISLVLRQLQSMQDSMSQAFSHMEECCRQLNSKIDRLLPPDPPSPVEPVTPEPPDFIDDQDVGELVERAIEGEPEIEVVETVVDTIRCNDLTIALIALPADELLAFLTATTLYGYDVTVVTSCDTINVQSRTDVLARSTVQDIYVTMENGMYVYDEIVEREVQYYLQQHKHVRASEVKVTTYISYWPLDDRCGEGHTNVYTERNFEARPPEITIQGEAPLGTVVINNVTTATSQATGITVAKSDTPTATTTSPVQIATPSEEPADEGRKRNWTLADHDPTYKPEIDESTEWHQDVKVEVYGDSVGVGKHDTNPNNSSFIVWPSGAKHDAPAVVSNLTVGSVLTPDQLHALGYRGTNDDKPVVVTNIDVSAYSSGHRHIDDEHFDSGRYAVLTVQEKQPESTEAGQSSVVTQTAVEHVVSPGIQRAKERMKEAIRSKTKTNS